MNAARDPSRLADAVADLKDPEMIKSAREMMAQAEPAFQVEMQRMMEQPAPPPSLLEDNSDLKLGYLIYLNRSSTLLCKALNFAEAKCNDVPSARCTARNSTFRLANRMLL